jgi:hypothetical protein
VKLRFRKIRLYGAPSQADDRVLLIDGFPSSVWSRRYEGDWWLRASLCGATESGRGCDGLQTFQTLDDVRAWVVGAIGREQQFYKEIESLDIALDMVAETVQD